MVVAQTGDERALLNTPDSFLDEIEVLFVVLILFYYIGTRKFLVVELLSVPLCLPLIRVIPSFCFDTHL